MRENFASVNASRKLGMELREFANGIVDISGDSMRGSESIILGWCI